MQFQAILLSLIILFSIAVTKTAGDNSAEKPPLLSDALSGFSTETSPPEITTGTPIVIVPAIAPTETSEGLTGADPATILPVNEILSGDSDLLGKNRGTQTCELSNLDLLGITAKTVLLKYADYGPNIVNKSPEKRWPIASITKLMTAIATIEKTDLNKKITISANAAGSEGAAGDFKEGEVFRAGDLLKAMLVISSNDAAIALAESYGQTDFVNEMQRKAADIRMSQTSYVEPTGLSFLNQSTVGDLSRLAEYIYANYPEIYRITRQTEIQIQELKSGKYRKLKNIDEFAGNQDFIGGKTGYIDAAGRNLVALFTVKNRPALSVVLGSDDAFKDTKTLKDFLISCE
ncbi:MAG: serine hydrolase [Candidatus Wolfebacteria bacterium]|nr:serine hydrolase [Candidatus Wolfebacteria bacterium]